jgi:hypothetical protein
VGSHDQVIALSATAVEPDGGMKYYRVGQQGDPAPKTGAD